MLQIQIDFEILFILLSLFLEPFTIMPIDEYTNFTWVINLKAKSDAADAIMSWVQQLERSGDTPAYVYTFISDQGGEYTGARFQSYIFNINGDWSSNGTI